MWLYVYLVNGDTCFCYQDLLEFGCELYLDIDFVFLFSIRSIKPSKECINWVSCFSCAAWKLKLAVLVMAETTCELFPGLVTLDQRKKRWPEDYLWTAVCTSQFICPNACDYHRKELKMDTIWGSPHVQAEKWSSFDGTYGRQLEQGGFVKWISGVLGRLVKI